MEKIISIVLYMLLLTGIVLTFLNSINHEVIEQKARKEALKKIHANEKSDKKSQFGNTTIEKVNSYIKNCINAVYGDRYSTSLFYMISLVLGIFGFAISFMFMTKKVVPLMMLLCALLPFVFLRMKLHEERAASSKEGEILCQEILNNYKIHHNSMFEAIRTSAFTITDEAPYSKRLLLDLSHKLNTAATDAEIRKAIEEFKFGIATTWAATLATNMELSQIEGIKVTSAMEDLIQTVIKVRKAAEERKRQKNESNKMLKYLVPGIYILTIFSAIKFFNFTFQKFCFYQFQTDLGSMWFLIIITSYIASIIFSSILGKQKMDI